MRDKKKTRQLFLQQDASEGEPKQFGLGWIPSPGSVQLDYDPGEVNIEVERKDPIITSKMNKPILITSPLFLVSTSILISPFHQRLFSRK